MNAKDQQTAQDMFFDWGFKDEAVVYDGFTVGTAETTTAQQFADDVPGGKVR